jgi:S1-C subfamily serine protease
VDTIPLTTQLADQLGVSTDRGAVVARMSRSTPAYDAGIRPGDVIVAFNGKPVDDPGQFLRMLADAPIKSTATVTVLRGDRRVDLKVPVEQVPRRTRRG